MTSSLPEMGGGGGGGGTAPLANVVGEGGLCSLCPPIPLPMILEAQNVRSLFVTVLIALSS